METNLSISLTGVEGFANWSRTHTIFRREAINKIHARNFHTISKLTREEGIKTLFGDAQPMCSYAAGPKSSVSMVYDIDDCIIRVNCADQGDGVHYDWDLDFACDDADEIDTWWDHCKDNIPGVVNDDPATISVNFWNLTPQGPSSAARNVEIAKFEEIAHNYPGEVAEKLERLMKMGPPTDHSGGKLILFHGPPGGGKTWAIRALADAWRDWCNVDCIIDPDELLGHAYYLAGALLSKPSALDDKWRLIIIEDSGEFMVDSAKKQSGQAMSRLLNVTDGLIGQGQKLIILMTTNEPFNEINEAVARSGRCLAEIDFRAFNPAEARQWFQDQNIQEAPDENVVLADLYRLAGVVEHLRLEKPQYTLPGYV